MDERCAEVRGRFMIISHKHKFVFIKTTKTAGTSVEIALSKHCGDQDIITRLHPDDEALREQKGYLGKQNEVQKLTDGKELRFFNHAPARRARRLIGPERWNGYFTFAFDRNPFDRVVSAYFYIKKNRIAQGTWDEHMTFSRFVSNEKRLQSLHENGWGLYTQNDAIIVDKVYQFEALNDAMLNIYSLIGIDENQPLEKTKVSKRKNSYRDIYNSNDRAIVSRVFEKEIETFGYCF